MTEQERWLAANDQYLATMLEWLRGRLDTMASAHGPERSVSKDVTGRAESARAEPVRPRSLRSRLFRLDRVSAAPTLPPPSDSSAAAPALDHGSIPLPAPQIQIADAERPPALMQLGQRLGLSEFERHTLLLCAAMELDTRLGALCAKAQDDASRVYPTFALALALFDQPAWDVLSPERPLRHWRLIEINQPGAQPLINSALKADERIVNYIKGLNYLDDRLAPLVTRVAGDDTPLPPSQAGVAAALVEWLKPRQRPGVPVIQLLGNDSRSKLNVATNALASLGVTLYRVAAEALPTQTADQETFVRLWEREAALLPIALYVDAAQVERAGNVHAAAVQRLFARSSGAMFLDAREAWPELGRDSISLDVAKPTAAEQQAAWAAALGEGGGELPGRLAGQFNFDAATIRAIATDARTRARAVTAPADAVWDMCVSQARPALDQLAERVEPKVTWDDLELPSTEKMLLGQIAGQVKARAQVYDGWGFRERMNRGLGISVLFAGESGTGKTMAAEVLANELKLSLYRIDLSAVVSKFIGETEKNLRRLFDAAEDGGGILLFDEADALFGKRSEVRDSHDRYANIEINYLLQRMEAYRGLAILATNMKSALDRAFVRRLRFVVTFPFPGPAERQAIWRNMFPPQVPLEGVDFARLARLNLAGGSINKIALNAAFLAAQTGSAVTMPLILDAARTEFRTLEKPINEADFRWLEPVEAKR
jgi:ATPase family associated with various cellular activities (AAA)